MKKNYWIHSVLTKLIVIIMVLLIPVNVLLIVGNKSSMELLKDQVLISCRNLLELNIQTLVNEMGNLDRISYDLQDTEDFLKLSEQVTTSLYQIRMYTLNRQAVDELTKLHYSDGFFFYSADRDDISLAVKQSLNEEKDTLYQALRESTLKSSRRRWGITRLGDEEIIVNVSGYRDVHVGTVILVSDFCKTIRSQLNFEDCYVALGDHETIDGDYLQISVPIAELGEKANIYVSNREIHQQLPLIRRISYYVSISYILLIPLLFTFLWLLVIRPLNIIEQGLVRLQKGEQDYRIKKFKSSIEFESMAATFNGMASTIEKLTIDSYEKKLQQERMALQNLLLQTRPHFLLNTFNMISIMAQMGQMQGIETLTQYLSNYFRYLYNGAETRSVAEEMELVDKYIEVAQLRYPNCFAVSKNMDEDLLSVQIPALMIHNFVENVFKYTVNEGTKTQILISLIRNGSFAEIHVEDNGAGMDPEILEKIRNREPIQKEDGIHIGIYNSGYRLKTFCGEGSELIVESESQVGTHITIRIPMEEM